MSSVVRTTTGRTITAKRNRARPARKVTHARDHHLVDEHRLTVVVRFINDILLTLDDQYSSGIAAQLTGVFAYDARLGGAMELPLIRRLAFARRRRPIQTFSLCLSLFSASNKR